MFEAAQAVQNPSIVGALVGKAVGNAVGADGIGVGGNEGKNASTVGIGVARIDGADVGLAVVGAKEGIGDGKMEG